MHAPLMPMIRFLTKLLSLSPSEDCTQSALKQSDKYIFQLHLQCNQHDASKDARPSQSLKQKCVNQSLSWYKADLLSSSGARSQPPSAHEMLACKIFIFRHSQTLPCNTRYRMCLPSLSLKFICISSWADTHDPFIWRYSSSVCIFCTVGLGWVSASILFTSGHLGKV